MNRFPSRLILAALLCLASFSLVSADWPQWRGPARDGISKETGLLAQWPQAGPPLAWKAAGLGKGFSSVAVTGGKIFTMGDRADGQHVIALSGTDGKVLWTAKVGPVWEDEFAGPRGTPTVDGDRVYAIGTEGDLVALEAATGKVVWHKHMERDLGGRVMSVWKWSESPLVDGDRLIVTPGLSDSLMVALDKKTGKEIWRAKAAQSLGPKGKDGAGYSSVVISNGGGVKQYVQLTGRGLIGVRAEDGKLLWNYNPVANDVANIPTPVVQGDYVFSSTGYQTGSALLKLAKAGDGVTAQEVYFLPARSFQNHHGGFVLIGDHIYGGHGHNKGFPVCLELSTGKLVWGGDGSNVQAPGTGSAAVTAADGHLYFRYQNGKMALIEATPQGYKQTGLFDIPNVNAPSWSHPVVAGGKLYLREQDNLYVYDVKRG
ncbi:MAG TPA: PQQ-binding-like beta-propeller repeat protein [Thermoanaerobaculia bacterium]|nr:PQQ-binding-like beta-propeller repeat protein [Thermoanaerobaculia bacterium]